MRKFSSVTKWFYGVGWKWAGIDCGENLIPVHFQWGITELNVAVLKFNEETNNRLDSS